MLNIFGFISKMKISMVTRVRLESKISSL
jgi:hypothetical protein